jgi:putative transposase
VDLRAYETPAALRLELTHYFQFSNTERRHQALNRRTPDSVYGANLEAEKAA